MKIILTLRPEDKENKDIRLATNTGSRISIHIKLQRRPKIIYEFIHICDIRRNDHSSKFFIFPKPRCAPTLRKNIMFNYTLNLLEDDESSM
jgi:hypothetical protein